MKFYIASRAKRADQVKRIVESFKDLGHSITLDWFKQPYLQPYDKNYRRSRTVSQRMLNAIRNCDYFILLTDKAGTGMHTEFGIALSEHKKIFVVGKHLNTNIFFFHPNVKKLNSIEELIKKIKRRKSLRT
ncbi:MAG: nucleoside 2-deoxyribosyltransferase [Candidatus Jorgensenbacteria bacterium]